MLLFFYSVFFIYFSGWGGGGVSDFIILFTSFFVFIFFFIIFIFSIPSTCIRHIYQTSVTKQTTVDSEISANSVKRHICDVKIRD